MAYLIAITVQLLLILAEYIGRYDLIILSIFFLCFLFLKKYRKTVFQTYLIFALTVLSYALYEVFWLLLALILLLKQPYMVSLNEKKWISAAYNIRENRIFKGMLIFFFLISLKNYVYYGTNVMSGIIRPVNLAIQKRNLEREVGELVWAVPYYEDFVESKLTFRTRDYFPVDNSRELYRKKLSTQAEEYEREMFDRLFPYEKDYEIDILAKLEPVGGYKNAPTYKEIIHSEKQNLTIDKQNFPIYIRVRIPKDIFKSEEERRKVENGAYEIYSYYRIKDIPVKKIYVRSYSKNKKFIDRFNIFGEDLEKVTSLNDLKKYWIEREEE